MQLIELLEILVDKSSMNWTQKADARELLDSLQKTNALGTLASSTEGECEHDVKWIQDTYGFDSGNRPRLVIPAHWGCVKCGRAVPNSV